MMPTTGKILILLPIYMIVSIHCLPSLTDKSILGSLADTLAPVALDVLNKFHGPLSPILKLTDDTYSTLYGKYTPDTKTDFDEEYDYIIVGAGSGGSTLAGRLSEESCAKVLLLEAGPTPSFLTEIPILARIFYGSDIDWKIFTVSQTKTAAIQIDRRVSLTVGKTIGGSSTWNAMFNIRGNRKNYDDWAAGGATGWSYKDVRPYFLKMDGNRIRDFDNPTYHNRSGPVTAERPSYNPDFKKAVFEAAANLNYPIVDSNAETQYGFFDFAATIRDGRRCSAAKAYLIPADGRSNLDIVVKALVTKVDIDDNKRARGVYVEFNGGTRFVKARQEVIVSAGAVHTPQLLMLSGIGPKEQLEKLQIPVKANLQVGKNLQDHPGTFLPYTINGQPEIIELLNPVTVAQYITSFKGPLSSADMNVAIGFLSKFKNMPPDTLPDYELYFANGFHFAAREQMNIKREEYNTYYGPHEGEAFVWCIGSVLNPKTRGTVTLNSSNIHDPPLVDPNYYDHPDDFHNTVAGLRTCHEMLKHPAFQELNPRQFSPDACRGLEGNDDEYLPCMARTDVFSFAHPAGTAKMGREGDPTAVVDAELRVHGIKRLRVVDASIMPQVTSGNTNVPTMMIGEKAADMIKGTFKCVK